MPITLSAIFHLFLLMACGVLWPPQNSALHWAQDNDDKHASQSTAVTFVNRPITADVGNALILPQKVKFGLAALAPKIHLPDFLPKGSGELERGEWSQSSLGRVLGAREENSTRRFFSALHKKIHGHLSYPSEVVEAGKEGQVKVEFFVDSHGRIVGDFLRVESGDRILKVLALKSLRKSLATPLPVQLLGGQEKVKIQSTFHFFVSTRYHGSNLIEQKNQGTQLYFYKTATDPRVFETTVGRAVARKDDPRVPVKTTFDVFGNGLIEAYSDSTPGHKDGTGSVGFGINYARILEWLVEPKHSGHALEKYKDDPDF